jgi:transcriptional regulator with XRE-family HTH domain
MTGAELKAKRVGANISGFVVCQAAGISRSRLSAIECGYLHPEEAELARIAVALECLITARVKAREAAHAAGWPACEVSL